MRIHNTICRRLAVVAGSILIIWLFTRIYYNDDEDELENDAAIGVADIGNTSIMTNFDDLFRNQLEMIYNIRSKFLEPENSADEISVSNANMILSPSPGYFDALQKFSGIRTVNLSASWSDVTSFMPNNLYKTIFINRTAYSFKPFTADLKRIKSLAELHKIPAMKNDTHVMLAFLHVIKQGTVTEEGFVTHKNLEIHPNGCKPLSIQIPNMAAERTVDEVFTISQNWGYGYFHFAVENLPRLASFITFLKNNPSIKVHVNEQNGFTRRFLKLLGFPVNRLISGTVTAKVIYLPSGVDCGQASVFPTQLLSLQMRSILMPANERRSVIVIKRSSRRWFDHHDSIWKMLISLQQDYGFRLELFPDDPLPPFRETVLIFQRAVMVIAPHGAGLSNVFFSKPGTVVIEGLCKNINYCYSRLSYILGHVYHGILPKRDCRDTTADMLHEPVLSSLKWLKETGQL